MATGRQVDTQLVIRARDEASQAVKAIEGALADLLNTQKQVASGSKSTATGIADVVTSLAGLDKAYSQIAGAQDRAAAAYQRQLKTTSESQAQLQALAKQLDAARAAQERFNETGPRTQGEQRRFANIAADVKSLEGQFKALQGTVADQEAQLERAAAAMGAFNRQARLADAVQAFTEQEIAAKKAAIADQQLVDAAAKLKAQLNPLAGIQANLNAELAEAQKLYRAGKINAEELAAAELMLKKNADQAAQSLGRQSAGGGKPTLFGLKPYELQNLSFQVNDVVTQLASGTSLTQTLAQQGGQLIQIFPRVGASIIAAFKNPAVLAFAATIGVVVAAMKDAGDRADRLRTFLSLLAADADRHDYGADKLNAAAQALDKFGLSATEAVDAVRVFLREGIRQDLIESFGEAAKNLADTMGVDLKQAATEVAQAFSHGYDAVKKLDDSYNFLTASQRESIRTLFEEGRAFEARRMAFEIFSRQQEESANKARGPWAQATRELGNAWKEFIALLSENTVIKNWAADLAELGETAAKVIRWIRGVQDAAADTGTTDRVKALREEIAGLQAELRDIISKGFHVEDQFTQRYVAALTKRIADLTAQVVTLQGGKGGDTINSESEAQRKARADQIADINAQRDLARTTKEMDGQRRIAEAGRLAFEAEMRKSGDEQIAQAQRQLAIEKETRDVQRDQAEAARQAAAERERAIQQFSGRVIGAEGGAGKNPNSSAQGFGQFVDGTWLEQFRKVFSEEAKNLSQTQILALRQNSTIAKAIIDNYARENAKFLESFGAKVTAGNLYLAHFLGPAGAKKVLTADPNMSVDKLLSADVIARNKGYLAPGGRPRTAGGLIQFIAGRVGDTGAAQSSGQQEIARLEADREDKQGKLNLAIDQENKDRQRTVDTLTEQNKLQDTALIAAQKKAAVDKAEADLRDRVARLNEGLKPGQEQLTLTEEQIKATRALAAAEFDAQNARNVAAAQRTEAERGMNTLEERRAILQQQISAAADNGDGDLVNKLRGDLANVNNELATAIGQVKQFWREVEEGGHGGAIAFGMTNDQVENVIQRLDAAQLSTQNWVTVLGVTGQQIAQTFTGSAVSAIDRFAQSIASGQNAFHALRDAFLQFAADFFRQIAQMIQQQLIFNLISGILRSAVSTIAPGFTPGAGITADAGATISANPSIFHAGGIAGSLAPSRTVDARWFQNAVRYHTGGIAGLRADEVPAILQRGEEVLTRGDPRHSANAGGGERVKVVNLFDPGEAVAAALDTRVGERAILNHVKANKGAWKAALA